MTDKYKSSQQRGIEAVRLYFNINKTTYNTVDEHVGINGIIHVTNIDKTVTLYNIQRTANYIGCNQWTLELFVPPHSQIGYRACLVRPYKSKVSDYKNTKGLYQPPDVASFQNHPWLNASEKTKIGVNEKPFDVFHTEDCPLRKLVVAEKSLRIDLDYGEENVTVTDMISELTDNGDPLNISVSLPKDKGYYEPDIRHYIDVDYKDNKLPDDSLYHVKLSAVNDQLEATVIQPDISPVIDKPTHGVVSDKYLQNKDVKLGTMIDSPPTSGSKLPPSFSFWNVAKHGLSAIGIGLVAALRYKYK